VRNSANTGWTQYSGSFTATNTSITLRIFTEAAFSGIIYYDNISLRAQGGGSSYDFWASANGVTGTITDDDDGDGRDNLYEYALNGNPTNGLDAGTAPALVKAGDSFEYTHLQRNDDPNLYYTVQTCTNLVLGSWTDSGSAPLGTNITGGVYDEVTNSIPTTTPQSYIRLKITNP